MTEEDLEAITARCEAATPVPWRSLVEGRDHTSGSSFIRTADDDIEMTGATSANQDFMAAARQDIPKLLTEVRRLRGLLAARQAASRPRQDRLDVWRDGGAIGVIAVAANGDPLDLGEHEVEDLISKLTAALVEERA